MESEDNSFEKTLSQKIDSFINYLERRRISIIALFAYIVFLAVVRDLSEYFLLDPEFVTTPHPWIYSIAHHVAFYVVVFLGLTLLLTAFSGRGLEKSVNFLASFYWIILLPPFLDYFVFGVRENYAYFSPTDFANALFHFSGDRLHYGQLIEVAVILFVLFSYPIWTQRSKFFDIRGRLVTILRVAFLLFFAFLSMFFLSTPGLYLPVGTVGGIPQFPAFDLVKYRQTHLFLFSWYLIVGLILSLGIVYIAKKTIFTRLFMSLRPFQTLFFGIIVAAGVVSGWRSSSGSIVYVTHIFETPYWVNLSFVGISIISAVLAWLVCVIWNDLSDRFTDVPTRMGRALASGLIDEKTALETSVVLAAISLFCALLLSFVQLFLLSIVFLISIAYSSNLIRLKQHMLRSALIGIGAFLAFIYGFVTPFSVVEEYTTGGIYAPHLTGAILIPNLTSDGVIIGFFMFLGILIGSMITDIEGYKEDIRGGVKTVYTVLGFETGVRVVAFLIFFASLTPLAIFRNIIDLVVFPFLGIAAAVSFNRLRRSDMVMFIAFIGLIYAALRYLNLFVGI
ncbi:MAG: UbiA family prenyltransferase [Methanomassiliicoccales archaeon]|nr:UbiA family prenyltransferase [Methanomassiliicoccales archaeon]